ncbi:MAG: heme lyase CcmF/NrfE family subunit [Actinomycetia bacterium]|nr:heme lyase CcmF/NrfE family subunit [Actinomycetes bacterium]
MPGLGRAALVLAFGLLLYAIVIGALGAWSGRRSLIDSARQAIFAAFGATAAATAVLVAGLGTSDFSLRYVADHTSRDLPIGYRLSALWSGQEGSLLLWLLVLLGVGTAAVALNRRLVTIDLPWTAPILGGVALFFALVLVFVSSPFATQAAPPDGLGLNPSLQNPYMAAHPPLLYLGYVGLTVPFVFAMAALVSRRVDERWLVATRRWTLFAWTCLGFGILLGAKWAYEEVGWGGWYAWDPVENAALMPWLVATAYLHSVMIQEKKNMLRVWNVVLVALMFTLSLFGTFLTRSGVLNSIHSFAESSIGSWFLGAIAVAAVGSTMLIIARLPMLRARTRLESLISREAVFLYNNLFLVAFALTVLWGVAWPLISEALRGVAVTVGAPYYDFFAIVFGLPLILLMAIGPLVAWRRSSLRALWRHVRWPALFAVAVGAGLSAAGARSSAPALIGYTFGAFVIGTIALEFARGTAARRRADASLSWPGALAGLVARNRRRYGGYIVHASAVLLLIGATGVSAFSTSRLVHAAPGESVSVGGYTLEYLGSEQRRSSNALEVRARLAVSRGGEQVGTVLAGRNRYFAEAQTSNEVGIRTSWLRAEDLFVIADRFDEDGSVFLQVIVNPLVNLIWLGGIVFVLGALVTMWPDAREQRRIAQRLEALSTFGEGSAHPQRGAAASA